MTQPVLHLDLIALQPTASAQARDLLLTDAAGLRVLEGVLSIALIEPEGGEFDLALLFLLNDFSRLEPFGTDPAYAHFLQGRVAPLLRAFAGADVSLEGEPAPLRPYAACLALAAPDETYDWEVRESLAAWAKTTLGDRGGSTWLGLAAGERQRYRGVVAVFSDSPLRPAPAADGRFVGTLLQGRARVLS